jgi:AmmeMemoRadiSam system protein B
MKKEYTERYPIVNGLFYPDSKEELENTVQGYIERIEEDKLYEDIKKQTGLGDIEKKAPLVIIAPHAGYIFSGKVQAYPFCLIKNVEIQTAVVIGPAHQKSFKGISVNLDNAYKTPVGLVDADVELSEQLIQQHSKIIFNQEAHLSEHAIEVQLPFLQIIQPSIRIVPVLFGEQSWETSEILKNALIKVIKKSGNKAVLVVSTDLSHYHPHVEAQALDAVLRRDIREMDAEAFYKNIQDRNSEACGFGGILTGMMFANEMGEGKSAELSYMDSGDVSGDRNKVVGYLSAAMY